jgi:F-type H+-transporting ATPase subunit epsilon
MADGVFALELVTPEEKLLDARARSVSLRSSEGELTVLDGHTPIVTDIVPGEVRVEPEEGEAERFAVHGGFMQVGRTDDGEGPAGTLVTLIAGVAEPADRIDVDRAERARAAAQSRVDELRADLGRSAPGPAGSSPASGTTPAVVSPDSPDHLTPEQLELQRAEAALRRAEVRLDVAGVRSS